MKNKKKKKPNTKDKPTYYIEFIERTGAILFLFILFLSRSRIEYLQTFFLRNPRIELMN